MHDRHRAGQTPPTVLVDAVEEAADIEEARRIAALLRDLAVFEDMLYSRMGPRFHAALHAGISYRYR